MHSAVLSLFHRYMLMSNIRAVPNILSAEIRRQLKQSVQPVELSQFVVKRNVHE